MVTDFQTGEIVEDTLEIFMYGYEMLNTKLQMQEQWVRIRVLPSTSLPTMYCPSFVPPCFLYVGFANGHGLAAQYQYFTPFPHYPLVCYGGGECGGAVGGPGASGRGGGRCG